MVLPASCDRPSQRRSILLALLLGVGLALVGCEGSSRETREWQPGDHDQPPGPGTQVTARPAGSAQPGDDGELVEIAWQRNCASCHGTRGRGDGPQGPMVRAPDLTRAEWQSKITDPEITEIIRKGRNRMPPFGFLPEQVVNGLVARIRTNRAAN